MGRYKDWTGVKNLSTSKDRDNCYSRQRLKNYKLLGSKIQRNAGCLTIIASGSTYALNTNQLIKEFKTFTFKTTLHCLSNSRTSDTCLVKRSSHAV